MKARYDKKLNQLIELPSMEKPVTGDDKYKMLDGTYGTFAHHQFLLDENKYNAHLSSLRSLPCSDTCKDLWLDGQEVVEGVEYELRKWCKEPDLCAISCCDCKEWAFPITVKSEDDLLKEAAHILAEHNNPGLATQDSAYLLKWREYYTALMKLKDQGYQLILKK